MANRRMFSKEIVDSDVFLDMPLSSQALYFHLSMRADDEGFVGNPKRIQRMITATDDDLRLLCMKQFIIPFESGIIVVRHWNMQNQVKKDRKKPTIYQREKAMLQVDENGAYMCIDSSRLHTGSDMAPVCLQNVSNLEPQDRLGKDRLVQDRSGEERREEESAGESAAAPAPASDQEYDYEFFKNTYNEICGLLPSCKMMSEKRKEAVRGFLKEFTQEQWREICELANQSEFLTGRNERGWRGANIDFLLQTDKATKTLEGAYSDSPRPTELREAAAEIQEREREGLENLFQLPRLAAAMAKAEGRDPRAAYLDRASRQPLLSRIIKELGGPEAFWPEGEQLHTAQAEQVYLRLLRHNNEISGSGRAASEPERLKDS